MAQRILIVDDNRESVRLVRAYLEQSDYQVLVAYDGETALQILRRERLDLVLLGLMGSGGEELEIIRVMRAMPSDPSPLTKAWRAYKPWCAGCRRRLRRER
jgi:DNA-binding response OmpR family regulator